MKNTSLIDKQYDFFFFIIELRRFILHYNGIIGISKKFGKNYYDEEKIFQFERDPKNTTIFQGTQNQYQRKIQQK